MRKYGLFALLALVVGAFAVTGCSNAPSSPSEVTDQTTLDERVLLMAEASYTAFAESATTLVTAGTITGDDLDKLQELDIKAKLALDAARAAYDAGQADSFAEALLEGVGLVALGEELLTGGDDVED